MDVSGAHQLDLSRSIHQVRLDSRGRQIALVGDGESSQSHDQHQGDGEGHLEADEDGVSFGSSPFLMFVWNLLFLLLLLIVDLI